jgi:amino acid adenylation domain-containing protein/non-ribosomal peptide synthase protein (TIGR01720 family)
MANPPILPADLEGLSPEQKRALLTRLLAERQATPARHPASFGQRRLWFLEQLEGDSGALYNMAALFRVRGPLRPDLLKRCVDEIVRRHAVLRVRFETEDDQVMQVVAPHLELPLPVEDLSGLPESEQAARALEFAADEQRAAFDLTQGPLVRSRLLRFSATEHRWMLTVHHSVSDGWSLGVFIRELTMLYPAFAADEPSPLPPLPIQYADFVARQRKALSGERLDRLIGFWRDRLADAPALLELPADRPRPPMQSGCGGRLRIPLPPELGAAFKALARRSGVTLFMAGLAAFAALLSRLTGQTDLVIGVPIANRDGPDLEPLIGFFANTLALRVDLSGDPDFPTLIGRVQRVALDAYARQEVPFEQLVDAIHPQRDLSRNPLFQVMFALRGAAPSEFAAGALEFALEEHPRVSAKFDLSVDLFEDRAGLSADWEYSADLFDAATVAGMADAFQTLLAGLVAAPEQPIGRLPLLDGAARDILLKDWNPPAPPVEVTDVVELFEARARLTPDAIAMADGERRLSYGALDALANRLAVRLQALGVGPDTLVGVRLERGPEMLVALLGVLKAGGAYLPLDPWLPAERLALVVRAAGPRVLLTGEPPNPPLPDPAPEVLRMPAESGEPAPGPAPVRASTLDNLAYVIYTSGSTGLPKGVMVSRRALAHFTASALNLYGVAPDDRVLQFAALSFDAAAEEIYPALAAGAALVPRNEPMLAGMNAFLERCAAERITVLDLPTAYWHQLTHEMARAGAALPETVRLVIIGGEQARLASLRDWHGLPRPTLLNTYGPSETTVAVTLCDLSRLAPDWHTVPVGRPYPHARACVLDRWGEPVPVGVTGELCIGGPALARGYLGNPALTAERFVPDPFGWRPGDRLYRTGDRARLRPDARIELLGRFDDQVKIRGFRIEPGEIEAVLASHPAIQAVAVMVRESETGTPRLVAYFVTKRPLDVTEPREFAKARLPHYMVPSDFVALDALPLLASGKIDRAALPAPALQPSSHAEPRTRAEQTLAAIWTDLLGLEKVGVHDNFFELGGDSIISIRVVARAAQAGLRLSARQMFEHQTIAELARVAESSVSAKYRAAAGLVEGEAPLIPIQHWIFEQNLPEPWHFNQAVLLEVAPELTPEAWQRAVSLLVAHHDALRLRFFEDATGWRQRYAAEECAEWFSHHDLSSLGEAEQSAAIEATAAALQTRLNMSQGPLYRVAHFFRGTGRTARLLWIVHHLAVDGVSWRILLEDLAAVSRRIAADEAVALPAKTSSYREWAEHLASRCAAAAQEADFWWAQSRADLPAVPVDYPEGLVANTVGSTAQVAEILDEAATHSLLRDVAREFQASVEDALLAALGLAYARWTGELELQVELESHGREEAGGELDLSRTVGWFTTLYPLLLKVRNPADPALVLVEIREFRRRVPERGLGYGILRYLSPDSDLRRRLREQPRPQIGFNYLGRFDGVLAHPLLGQAPESVGSPHSPSEPRSSLIDINCMVRENRLRVEWTYSQRVHRRETIENLARGFMDALGELLALCHDNEARGNASPRATSSPGVDARLLSQLARRLGKD